MTMRSLVLGRGITGSAVTAMSLTSRVLSLLLLVPAARVLPPSDFGVFSLTLGLAIAVANVVGNAPADLTATAATTTPFRVWRRVALTVVTTTVAGGALAVAGLVLDGVTSVVILGVVLSLSTVGPVLAMNLLRGIDRPVLGAALAYTALPLSRAAAATIALAAGADLEQLLFAIAAAGVLTGVLTILGLIVVRPVPSTDVAQPDPRRRGLPPLLAFVAGAAVSVAWLVIGQSGAIALTTVAGAAVLAAFVPTARLCESLTAIGIGYKSAANRTLQATSGGAMPPRAVGVLLGAFAVAAAALFAVAPWAVPLVFGPELRFQPAVALVLVAAAAVSSLVAVKTQLLFAARRHVRLAVSASFAAVVSIASSAIGAALWETAGVAGAMILTVAVWLTSLTVPVPPKEAPKC